ncbi:MAG: SOS response-associated peptidase [Bacteroidia bacterium]|nr:SOS response-associated peptidase [Bacteroidia bacterium]
MCGRYTFTAKPDPALVIQSQQQQLDLVPRYNIAPTQMALISPMHDPEHMHFYRWGLIPHWAKDVKIGYKMINARSETILEKASFKSPMKNQRCLVWGDGFFEWKKELGGKQPYYIGLKEHGLFAMAGLTSSWTSPQGEELRTFTIITTEPNELMEDIHDRMPVILPPAQRDTWMDAKKDPKDLLELLRPLPAEYMKAYPVGNSVGNVRNDHAQLIEPFSPPPTLFG